MSVNFLAKSVRDFIQTTMYKGKKAFPTEPGQRWYTWVYLARVDQKSIKVGITNDLNRRYLELKRLNQEIQYAWSMPTSQLVEKDIKRILHSFIKPRKIKEGEEPGYTEIIENIPMEPLILFIRLVILYVYIKYNFIEQPEPAIEHALRWIGGDSNRGSRINPNVIQYKDRQYKGYSDLGRLRATFHIYKKNRPPSIYGFLAR